MSDNATRTETLLRLTRADTVRGGPAKPVCIKFVGRVWMG